MKYAIILTILLSPFAICSQSLNIPLLTTSGTAQVYVPVDEVHFTITVSKVAPVIADARRQNVEESEKIVNILKSKGIPSKYIQTKRMSVGRNYIKNTRKQQWDGFVATQSIYVCLLDPSKYDEIADGFLTMDVASLQGPNFKSSKAAEAMETARINAVKIAKEKAQQLADALGQSIGPAKLVKENYATRGSADTYSTGTSLVPDVESATQSFQPGQLVIKAGVTVSFVLEE